jgi:outer membrane protein assembly factor BamB
VLAVCIVAAGCGRIGFDSQVSPICHDPAVQPGSPWPVRGGCSTHLGLSTRVGPHVLALTWMTPLGSAETCGSPTIENDGTIVIGQEDNTIGVVGITSAGDLAWRAATGNVSAPAAITRDRIYTGTQAKFSALDLQGNVIWSYGTDLAQVDSAPVVAADGTIYFGADDANLYALHPDGTLAWAFPTGGDLQPSPAIAADGTVIVGSSDSSLYAVTPAGDLAWRQQLGGAVSTASIAPDGTIYVGSADAMLHAFTPTGAIAWTFDGGAGAMYSPAIGPDGTIYIGSADHALYAVTPDGRLRWRYLTQGPVEATPTIGLDGTIYVPSGDGVLYAIDAGGELVASAALGGNTCSDFTSTALGADGTLYIGVTIASVAYLLAFGP